MSSEVLVHHRERGAAHIMVFRKQRERQRHRETERQREREREREKERDRQRQRQRERECLYWCTFFFFSFNTMCAPSLLPACRMVPPTFREGLPPLVNLWNWPYSHTNRCPLLILALLKLTIKINHHRRGLGDSDNILFLDLGAGYLLRENSQGVTF
jgi:hypothetical protein